MPRTCKVQIGDSLRTLTYLNFIADPLQNGCEFIAQKTEFLGIWGEFDDDIIEKAFNWTSFSDWKELLTKIFDPTQQGFILSVHVILILASLCIGMLMNRFRIRQLLIQKQEWLDKERLLMQQLWAALEEKLDTKKSLDDTKSKLVEDRRSLENEKAEKDNIQTKCWGLERNLKIIQSERDILEEKIRDLWKFSGSEGGAIPGTTSRNLKSGEVPTEKDLKACMNRVQDLQRLVKDLIQTHKSEQSSLISALANGSAI